MAEGRMQLSKGLFRKEIVREVSNIRERFGNLVKDPSNDELIDTLIKLHKDVAPLLLLNKIRKPFCLECLNNDKLFFPMFLIQEADEFCCPNCGITIPRISTETNQPIENPEDAKRRGLFGDMEKKQKPYMEIERLLTKYRQGAVRKRKSVKKSCTVE